MNQKLVDMLKLHEGYRLKPYKCTAGKNTIGVGHNYDANPLPAEIALYLKSNGQITDEMAMWLLEKDVQTAILDCERIYPLFKTFSENRQNALIDLMFNLGIGTMITFKGTLQRVNAGLWDEAARRLEGSAYYQQVGNRAKEICRLLREG